MVSMSANTAVDQNKDSASIELAQNTLQQAFPNACELSDAARELLSQDVFRAGVVALAVLRPSSADELAKMLVSCRSLGVDIHARGGGLSYTDAYLPQRACSVMLDMRGLDRIVEINVEDGYCIVETGVTWARLQQALDAKNVRTPYWGPLSGLQATVGGTISQGSTFLGSARYGSVGDTVIGLELLSVDGEILRTGSWAADANTAPFARYFGPDLTGVFIGDAGSLAIKTKAVLRLIPKHHAIGYLSFLHAQFAPIARLMSDVTRAGLASECFAFDPVLATKRMQRASLIEDVQALGNVVKKHGVLGGLKIALSGRGFLDTSQFSAHLSLEADSPAELAARLHQARALAKTHGVQEIDNSIPKVLHSQCFAPPNSVLGPNGERWAPLHGVLPYSKTQAAYDAIQVLVQQNQAELSRLRIDVGMLCTTIAAQGFLIEPVFYWPDEQSALHQHIVEPQLLKRLAVHAANPEGRALVSSLKRQMSDTLRNFGATHFQLGKYYRYREGRNPLQLAMLDALKRELDPGQRLNPGALV
jgi:FAD/FMN-containing dehydrogenase